MITYVNTVLVGTGVGSLASANTGDTDSAKIAAATNGQYIVVDNNGALVTAAKAPYAEAIKVGLKTSKGIKWSNIIKKADVKSLTYTAQEIHDGCHNQVLAERESPLPQLLVGHSLKKFV